MRNLNRAIAIICLTAVMICIGYRIKARADDIQWAPEVLQNAGAGDMTGIGLAYTSLTSEQKEIAAYLIGAFNNVYLMARGFSYSIPANETSWKAQFKALGNKVWQFATTAYGWKSRFNETFRQYLSSVCVYASGINTTFETWYQQNTGTGELYIPYNEDAFSAWTEFYNDPSGDGIASFGLSVGNWNSGIAQDFQGYGLTWRDQSYVNIYNDFILNYNPVFYTTPVSNIQAIVGYGNIPVIDTLFVERPSVPGNYQFARYGYSDLTLISQSVRFPYLLTNVTANGVGIVYSGIQYTSANSGTLTAPNTMQFSDLVSYMFNQTPFILPNYNGLRSYGYYHLISHVILVDNLSTLSNPEEIMNITDLDIVAPDPQHEPYIIAPNDRLLFPTRPIGYDDPLGFWNIVIDNSVDENGDPATEDDFHQQIVNNTTINNYYVSNDDRINVPVEWFENDLTDQLANDSIPFLTFARDCIDTLGDLQIYLYGAIVFGLGGGILKKFLL